MFFIVFPPYTPLLKSTLRNLLGQHPPTAYPQRPSCRSSLEISFGKPQGLHQKAQTLLDSSLDVLFLVWAEEDTATHHQTNNQPHVVTQVLHQHHKGGGPKQCKNNRSWDSIKTRKNQCAEDYKELSTQQSPPKSRLNILVYKYKTVTEN